MSQRPKLACAPVARGQAPKGYFAPNDATCGVEQRTEFVVISYIFGDQQVRHHDGLYAGFVVYLIIFKTWYN
jgi:hypothetical protein